MCLTNSFKNPIFSLHVIIILIVAISLQLAAGAMLGAIGRSGLGGWNAARSHRTA